VWNKSKEETDEFYGRYGMKKYMEGYGVR